MKKLPTVAKKINSSTSKDYYAYLFNNKRNEFQLANIFRDVAKKIQSWLNMHKIVGVDQIPVSFLKEAAMCQVIHFLKL